MLKEREIPIYGTRVDYGIDVSTLREKDRKKYALVMGNEVVYKIIRRMHE